MMTAKSTISAEFFEKKKRYKRIRRHPYKLYIPENLDIDFVLMDYPPNAATFPKNYKQYRDKFVYILNLITSIPNSKNDFDFDENYGFTPINKVALRNRIHDYKNYIEYLKERGIIIEGNSYQVGISSRGLKFSEEYKTKVKPVAITSNSLIKSIVTANHNRDIEKEKKLSFLLKWFNDNLNIEYKPAIKFIEEDKHNALIKAKNKRLRKNIKTKNLALLPSIEEIVELGNISKSLTIAILRDKDFRHKLKFDLTTGRFHTPLTRLKKELRTFVTYGNERLVNIDITNSQPLLSLIILDIDIFKKLNIGRLITQYNPSYKEIKVIKNEKIIITNSFYTILVNLIVKSSKMPDLIEYKRAVINGEYYEKFGETLVKNGLIPDDIINISDVVIRLKEIRKYAKTATFQSLFDTKKAASYNPVVKAFKTCYPSVYKIFQQVKSGERLVPKNGKVIKESTYNTLACILQRFESFLVLEKTCVEINSINPNIPLFTIHDSIITTESKCNIVKQIFEKNIEEQINVKPKLQIEKW